MDIDTQFGKPRFGRFQFFREPFIDNNSGTGFGQTDRDGHTNPVGAAGDQGIFAGQIK